MSEVVDTTTWDALVIGGGAAGLTAGIVLARARFATMIVDGGPPRNAPAEAMHGFPTRDGMPPEEFVATGKAEFTGYGGILARASAVDARRTPEGEFEIRLSDGRLTRARSVLVATGITDELPDIPGLAQGWATVVHHCPHCHGYEVRGTNVAVIGGAMAAVSIHLAALMRRHTKSVTFCANGFEVSDADRQRLTAYGVRLVDGLVRAVAPEGDCARGELTAIRLEGGETVICDAIFVAPRPIPHDSILTALGANADPASGLIAVDSQGATSVPGLWAAGNVVNPRAQVVTAAGAGSTAAVNMTGWLLEKEMSAAGGDRP
ncbi:thioredoxin reductase [Nocardia tenerifensis]|uniref:Thioredoxin reductase n=1 Tax=Nocardia tenerifensis TaxID=228006 RepID=A0A318K2P4_9NOCA|nr:NAD(P)/FAD-dependent oxidoreductase [Nocardia tenerifensis]PXX61754.1 thioredoxin reductase [Nocardia tenerifensis]